MTIDMLQVSVEFHLLAFIPLLQLLFPRFLYGFGAILTFFFEDGGVDQLEMTIGFRDPTWPAGAWSSGLVFIGTGICRVGGWQSSVSIQYQSPVSMNLPSASPGKASRSKRTTARSPS